MVRRKRFPRAAAVPLRRRAPVEDGRAGPRTAGVGGGAEEERRGAHTLRVLRGTVVGVHGDDVFVELGAPRMQGVISRRSFAEAPRVGDEHEFTLRGQEESLWVVSLRAEQSLATWEEMEVGSLVLARLVRVRQGGLEGKVGPLHAFVPKSQTGLARDKEPGLLVGKELVCEVIDVDRERQRCTLSRKSVLQRERERARGRRLADLVPGELVQGRVTRVEPFGAFVSFGEGKEGLVHVSNLAWRRVRHPSELVAVGDVVSARVLAIRAQGKRIALGMKQLEPSPWSSFARRVRPGDLLLGTIVRVKPYGLFVELAPGVAGLLHRSETGLGPDEPLGRLGGEGRELAVRVLSLEPERERLALSHLHPAGAPIAPEEARPLEEVLEEPPEAAAAVPPDEAEPLPGTTPLRTLLRRALPPGDEGS